MDITYFALKPIMVGGELRQPGDLIPEARDWAALTGYISDARIAPVMIATLPKPTRDMLAAWDAEQVALLAAPKDTELDINEEGTEEDLEDLEDEDLEDLQIDDVEEEVDYEEANADKATV